MPGRFLRRVGLDADVGRVTDRYLFTLPVVVWLARCRGGRAAPGVTFWWMTTAPVNPR
ncbi:MAG: hypothetical protein WCB57_07280 [Pseudonocardiaceae bacterium]